MLLEGLETLAVLAREGTMGKTASRLYLTQSAVSKRIATLEARLGRKLIEPEGRHIRLTPEAQVLLNQANPSLAKLKAILFEQMSEVDTSVLNISASEPVLAGHLGPFLAEYLRHDPYISIGGHRTPTIVERVRSGDHAIGLCTGQLGQLPGLTLEVLKEEPMLLVYGGDLRARQAEVETDDMLDCLCIDLAIASNRYLKDEMQALGLRPAKELNSHFAIAQLARSGYMPALLPSSIVTLLNIPAAAIHPLPERGEVSRPVNLLYRQGVLKRRRIAALIDALRAYFA
ncbi:LysR family transcriptional regulator [Pokkaliibacter sp. CJK22405]|uniref:LysR family transcriptional regulator n=1 Tax=Pokkaliibacter sp. CJK22405 TaxID=3384615 RepID=UPI003984D47A